MIDRVEFGVLHQPEQVRELQRHDAARLEKELEPRDEADEVGHVRKDVVPDEKVRLLARRTELAGGFETEELDEGGNSGFVCGRGDVAGRLDAQHRHAALLEVPEEVAVVARDLDDPARGVEAKPLDRLLRVGASVAEPAVRVGREVGVVAEHLCGGHDLR